MSLTITTVDAFTNTMFSGNPAAVTVLPEPRPEAWMQSLAMEMNLAETSFLTKQDDGSFGLRWFTPVAEVDLCGHATIAAAHVLWQTGALGKGETARFHTRSGLLSATKRGDWIELNFPAIPVTECEAPAGLLESLRVTPVYLGRSKFDYLLEVTELELEALAPDYALMARVGARGTIVTSRSEDSAYDFRSRFFAPALGINEDPVTGSAHCVSAPYWAEKLGKNTMVAHQSSPRGGVVKVELNGDRVLISGQAVTVLIAQLMV